MWLNDTNATNGAWSSGCFTTYMLAVGSFPLQIGMLSSPRACSPLRARTVRLKVKAERGGQSVVRNRTFATLSSTGGPDRLRSYSGAKGEFNLVAQQRRSQRGLLLYYIRTSVLCPDDSTGYADSQEGPGRIYGRKLFYYVRCRVARVDATMN